MTGEVPARPGFCLDLHHGSWRGRDAAKAVGSMVDVAALAEAAGLESIWVSDDQDGWDAFAVLGALARETTTIRLGTGVTNPLARNPNGIAAGTATIDWLSGGRAFLGLGRGQPEWAARIGNPADHPFERLVQLLDLLDGWWGPEGYAQSSGPLRVDWDRGIAPLGRPPVYLAAVGPKALALAGQRADGVLFNRFATPTFVEEAVGTARNAAVGAGRDPDQLRFFVNPAIRVTDDPEPVLLGHRRFVATIHTLPGMDRLLASPNRDAAGILAAARAVLASDPGWRADASFPELARSPRLADAVALVPTGLIDEAAAIGPESHVRDRILTFMAAGATDFFLDRAGLPTEPAALAALLRGILPGSAKPATHPGR